MQQEMQEEEVLASSMLPLLSIHGNMPEGPTGIFHAFFTLTAVVLSSGFSGIGCYSVDLRLRFTLYVFL